MCSSSFLWGLQVWQTTFFSAKAAWQELESKDAGDGDDRVENPPSKGWEFEWLYVWKVNDLCVFCTLFILPTAWGANEFSSGSSYFLSKVGRKVGGSVRSFFCELKRFLCLFDSVLIFAIDQLRLEEMNFQGKSVSTVQSVFDDNAHSMKAPVSPINLLPKHLSRMVQDELLFLLPCNRRNWMTWTMLHQWSRAGRAV